MSNIKNKKEDLKDRLAALMIYKKLKEETNPRVFISSLEMTRLLETEYGKENAPSHNTVAKYLKAMKDYSEELDIDVRRGNRKQGYCLGDREFSDWEIELFVSTIMKSKTLSVEDKRDIIFKCYNHLGYKDEEIDIIFEYLKETKDKIKKQKQEEKENIPEILEKLNKAIKEKKQIKMYLSRIHPSSSNVSDRHLFFVVSPYKIFTFNDNTYLMYGKKSNKSNTAKSFIVNYRDIKDIYDLEVLSANNYCPIESYEPFKNGINQTKLNRDPFGYIRQKNDKPVQIEIIASNEYTIANIKKNLRKEFSENVEFASKGKRNIAYIYGSSEKCMQFLFRYSDVCIVVGPQDFKMKFKSHLIRTFMRYSSNKKHIVHNMLDFMNNDDYIEKAHLSMDTEKERRSKQAKETKVDKNIRRYVKKK